MFCMHACRYLLAREYLKVDRRVEVLNTRMDLMKELFELLHDELDTRHGSFLEWIVIVLIVVGNLVYFANRRRGGAR